jgi:hypothetical protein
MTHAPVIDIRDVSAWRNSAATLFAVHEGEHMGKDGIVWPERKVAARSSAVTL